MFVSSKCGPRLSAAAAEKLKNRYVLMRSGAREHERETDKRPSIPITVRYYNRPPHIPCIRDGHGPPTQLLLKWDFIFCCFQAAGGCGANCRIVGQDEAAGCGWRGGGRRGPQTLPGVHTGCCTVWQPLRCVVSPQFLMREYVAYLLFSVMSSCHCSSCLEYKQRVFLFIGSEFRNC